MQTLRTERLELVVLDPARDAADLHLMLGDPGVHLYSPQDARPDVASTRAQLEEEFAGNGGMTWAIRLAGSTEALGTVGVFYDQGTTIRGVGWSLRRSHWGRGIMGEAAPAAIAYLLTLPKVDGVEAWIDTRNARSIGVARRAGLAEAGRMPRVYADHVAQQVVMARAAEPRDPIVVGIRPQLPVRDVPKAIGLLGDVLGMRVQYADGDPPTYAMLGMTPWTAGGGLDLRQGDDAPAYVVVDIGDPTDDCYQRAVEAGMTVVATPEDMPWNRREFTLLLDDNRLRVSGPTRPERQR
jgi:RimJ/RimL family protein N-acetyltransferase